MQDSTPATLRNFTVFGTIAEAWHLTKGAKWAILAPILVGMLFILGVIAVGYGLSFIVVLFHGINVISLLVIGMIIALVVRFISIKIQRNSIIISTNFY